MQGWRYLFLALETLVAGTFFLCFAQERVWRIEPESLAWSVLFAAAAVAWLFLLIASPFFLKSLRSLALTGWLIAFAVLLFGELSPAL